MNSWLQERASLTKGKSGSSDPTRTTRGWEKKCGSSPQGPPRPPPSHGRMCQAGFVFAAASPPQPHEGKRKMKIKRYEEHRELLPSIPRMTIRRCPVSSHRPDEDALHERGDHAAPVTVAGAHVRRCTNTSQTAARIETIGEFRKSPAPSFPTSHPNRTKMTFMQPQLKLQEEPEEVGPAMGNPVSSHTGGRIPQKIPRGVPRCLEKGKTNVLMTGLVETCSAPSSSPCRARGNHWSVSEADRYQMKLQTSDCECDVMRE